MSFARSSIVGKAAIATALLSAGCDGEKPKQASAPDRTAEVRAAAEDAIRSTTPDRASVAFRGVQVWPQAIGNTYAVCGQARTGGAASLTYFLFVATVTHDPSAADLKRAYQAEVRIGSSTTEATRAYLNTVARCYESGGPQSGPRQGAIPIPPLPSDFDRALQEAAPPVALAPLLPSTTEAGKTVQPVPRNAGTAPQATPAPSPAQGTVVLRQNANVRTAPHGDPVRVEQQGREFRVFGEAPGGWLQVGDAAPAGWVHSSMVQRR